MRQPTIGEKKEDFVQAVPTPEPIPAPTYTYSHTPKPTSIVMFNSRNSFSSACPPLLNGPVCCDPYNTISDPDDFLDPFLGRPLELSI